MSAIKAMWNVWMTSAETARIRLHGVVAQDRKACGDGKWVKVRNKNPSWIPGHWEFSEDPMFRELAQEWRRHDKMAFRWIYRR